MTGRTSHLLACVLGTLGCSSEPAADASVDAGDAGDGYSLCEPDSVVEVMRLNGGMPIITEAMFAEAGAPAGEGANINGPSVIRVPDWLPIAERADPAARYYLYFGNHLDAYIRMAWATDVAGPWHLHGVGPGVPIGSRGVFDLGADAALALGNGLEIVEVAAAPDVHVDDAGGRFVMYFRGVATYQGLRMPEVKTFVAVSDDGLDFNAGVEPVILGAGYFRVFAHQDMLYALAIRGAPYRARDAAAPWAPPLRFSYADELWERSTDFPWVADLPRHVTVRLDGDVLHVLFSAIGDTPEHILHTTIDLSGGDFMQWYPAVPTCVLKPELPWEGGDLPAEPSQPGDAPEDVSQLRDPFLFEDADGQSYLFYAGRGEDAIGVAAVRFR